MKRVVVLFMALLCVSLAMIGCVLPPQPAGSPTAGAVDASATPTGDVAPDAGPTAWIETYAAVAEDHAKNKQTYLDTYFPELIEFWGINMLILDIDRDSIAELLVCYIALSQVDYTYGYFVYKAADRGAQAEMIGQGICEYPACPLMTFSKLDDRHRICYAEADGEATMAYYEFRNEGSYDYALRLHAITLEDGKLIGTDLITINTPQSYEEMDDAEIDKYLKTKFSEALAADGITMLDMDILSTGIITLEQTEAAFS